MVPLLILLHVVALVHLSCEWCFSEGGGGVVELPAVSFKGYSFGLPCVHCLALFTFPYKLPTEPDTVYTRASQ